MVMNHFSMVANTKKHKHLTCKFIHSLHLSKQFTSLFFKTMKGKNSSICCFACIVHRKFINPYTLNADT